MNLAGDGTGELELCSGVVTFATWALRWTGSGPEVSITIGDKTHEPDQPKLLNQVHPGQELSATVGDSTLDLYGYIPGSSWKLKAMDSKYADWRCGNPPVDQQGQRS